MQHKSAGNIKIIHEIAIVAIIDHVTIFIFFDLLYIFAIVRMKNVKIRSGIITTNNAILISA